jgi:SAM-dependent methyltransferase
MKMEYNQFLFELLILLAVVVLVFLFYKSLYKKKQGQEGFQQQEKFVLKENIDVYDDFYGEIYDTLMLPNERVKYEIEIIFKSLQPSQMHANMLDIGSGSGVLVNYLKEQGYRAYGLEKSKAMIDISKERYNIDVKCTDVEESMAYDRALFTHIFCMNFTIYEIENKFKMFKNCYYWLQNNGYLIIHLADKDNFNTIIPAGKTDIIHSIQQLDDKRITSTFIDFADFTYKSDFANDSNNNKNCMIHKETFTDKATNNIRQNERMLYFDTTDEIIDMALRAGFIARGFTTMENGPSRDKYQRIYILERLM